MKPALLTLAVLAVLVAADRGGLVLLTFAALVGVDVAVLAWVGGRR